MNSINTALCSFGMSGKLFHAPFIHLHDGLNLVGAWERSKKIIQGFYPATTSYDSYEALLNDSQIELVIVNTPNITHYDFAKQALQAGKHVVLEKPFSVTVKEGEELIALAKEKSLIISAYQNRRYDSDYKTVKKVLDENLLGEVVEAEIHYDRYTTELSYKTHKEEAVLGTGVLYDLGAHLIDQALQLFGKPDAVFADMKIIRPISKVDDYFEVLLYYPNLRARLKSTLVAREAPIGYIIHGTKGSFIKPKTNGQEVALMAERKPNELNWGIEEEEEWGLLHTEKDGTIIRQKLKSERGQYMDYYEGIYQAIRNGKPVPVTAEEGLEVIKVIEAAYQSSNLRKVVDYQ
jgi:scyllo-inositol 2-dehydrogenase (NADP+)